MKFRRSKRQTSSSVQPRVGWSRADEERNAASVSKWRTPSLRGDGKAGAVKQKFLGMSADERGALARFLKSL
jgi:CxxC motif-containing protein (DUF1111 family)